TPAGGIRHDPAVDVPPLPELAAARTWRDLEHGSDRYHVTLTHLMRGRNRVTAALRDARALIAS
ncbi:MAG: hypothetical protein QN120_15320, partial [Armatimonadota bacterium]|nr:hypothetical protein [Armatimonadota bacterium]